MRLKKHDIAVDCDRCRCVHSDGCGGFDVAVPVTDDRNGSAGEAILHCTVSADRHRVTLTAWRDGAHKAVMASDETGRRVSATLAFVAENRVCGNRRICPSEVVRIVRENGG